ncbi:MAG: hypothetical protein ING44_15690 [Telmatospirillum sp.]|nr:hypothetical protein [Telmatospirillum sp.]
MDSNTPDLTSVSTWFVALGAASIKFETAKKSGDPDKVGEAARGWYTIAAQVLATYCLAENWPDGFDNPPTQHLPFGLAESLRKQFRYLGVGQIPGPMRAAKVNKKGKNQGPDESQDIGVAVSYIQAARDGIVSDSNPLKTVASAYGASKRTIQRWQSAKSWVTSDMFFPGVAGQELAERVTDAMRKAGAEYKAAGRTQVAVARRARKRRQG